MTSSKPRIAFAGLGAMGGGMASNLVKHGFKVTGFDVYQPLVDKFADLGGRSAKTPKEAALSADIMISMVANAAQNASLLFEGPDAAIQGLGKGTTFILCSTCPPSFAENLRARLDDEFGRTDVKLLDCPVSGGTLRAADGTLSIFESGSKEDLKAAAEVLQCMSSNLYTMGGIGNGQKTKAIHQLVAATNIIAASEAAGLAATVGLNTQETMDYVNKSDGASFFFENRLPHMLKNDWHPYSALGIILKDAGIVNAAAREISFPTPLSDCAEEMYLQGVQAGLLKDDDAKLVQLYLPKSRGDLVSRCRDADVKLNSSHQVSKDTIVDLLSGIHLAAAVEAMALCKALGTDRKIMCEIISKAAGSSAMFVKCIPKMLGKDSWSLVDCEEAANVQRRLEDVIDKCRKLQYPCPMASTALQRFFFAGLSMN